MENDFSHIPHTGPGKRDPYYNLPFYKPTSKLPKPTLETHAWLIKGEVAPGPKKARQPLPKSSPLHPQYRAAKPKVPVKLKSTIKKK